MRRPPVAALRQQLLRHRPGILGLDPAGRDVLREAVAVRTARARYRASLGPDLPARLRQRRPGRRRRDLGESVPPMAHGQPPRTRPGRAAQAQGRPGLAPRDPVQCARHEQRIRKRHPAGTNSREDQRLLAHPFNPLPRHCRIRSYLTISCSHGHHPLEAIHDGTSRSASASQPAEVGGHRRRRGGHRAPPVA
jgi:hypothetical protein